MFLHRTKKDYREKTTFGDLLEDTWKFFPFPSQHLNLSKIRYGGVFSWNATGKEK